MVILLFAISFATFSSVEAEEAKPLNVIIVWHYHQPYYRDPMRENFLLMPWVRVHSAKNYYRMAEIVTEYPDIHVTFDFSGSLMEQIEDYVERGAVDLRELLSRTPVQNLTIENKMELLAIPGGMFDVNWGRIVTKVPKFNELLIKRQEAFILYDNLPEPERSQKITAHFLDQDYTDLIALFNLHWLDPEYVKRTPEISPLLDKGYNKEPYTRSDIDLVLDHHRELINKVVPIYKELIKNGQVEVAPTPYTHPILPLLADFGWDKDVQLQIQKGIELFTTHFGVTPKGMWSPEAAVNENSVLSMATQGITWTLADESTLVKAGIDTSNLYNLYRPYMAKKDNLEISVFFRDLALSNKVSFTYQGWGAEKAIVDFESSLLSAQELNKNGGMCFTIALDGENPWEGYPNNGNDFLHALYKRLGELQKQGRIRTTTPSEYLGMYELAPMKVSEQTVFDLKGKDISLIADYKALPSLEKLQVMPERSWAGDLAVWIGEKQENIAWMWVAKAREALENVKNELSFEKYEEAQDLLLVGETSCWWFWYGTDMSSGFDHGFTRLHQLTLHKLYQILGEEPPGYLSANHFPNGEPFLHATPEKPAADIISIKLDGVLEEGEWENAAKLLTPDAKFIDYFYVGYDYSYLYVGIKPKVNLSKYFGTDLLFEIVLQRYCTSPWETNTLTKMQKKTLRLEMDVFPFTKDYIGIPISNEIHLSFENITEEKTTMNVLKAKGDETYELRRVLDTLAVESNGLEIQVPFEEFDASEGDKLYLSIIAGQAGKLIDFMPRKYAAFGLRLPKYKPMRETLLEVDDPEGDDYGPGTYIYPKAEVFKEGVFDIVRFAVRADDEVLEFEFEFKSLGGNPWGGPNGFCLQVIQVYLDTAPGGRTDPIFVEAPRIRIDENHPWNFAFQAGPGWEPSNLLIYENGDEVTGELAIESDQAKNLIIISVPRQLVAEVMAEEYTWHVVAVVGSWDGYGKKGWRMIATEPEEWGGGGASAKAVLADVQPLVYDILLPEGVDQKEVLSGYDVDTKTYAAIPAIAIGEEEIPVTEEKPSIPEFPIIMVGVVMIVAIVFLLMKKK